MEPRQDQYFARPFRTQGRGHAEPGTRCFALIPNKRNARLPPPAAPPNLLPVMPRLSWNEVKARAIRFSREWSEATSERADKQTFYNEFFDVFGIRRASVASFEANVRNLQGNTSAIDLLWRGKLIAEHKSRGESLDQAETQAFTYIEDLTREGRFDEVPRFVMVSDFASIVLYDLEPEEQRNLPLFAGRPLSRLEFPLADFPRHIRAFAFILGQTRVRLDPEDPANERAYAKMCELHDALKAGGYSGHDLERLLVRILFCVFAEDTGIFEPEAFTNFIRQQTREDGSDLGAQLNSLFAWLNNAQSENRLEDTDPLYGFRYVNGGLFAERLDFPRCNRAMRAALLECCEFHWAKISPAVFGSLFQGVIDDRARRQQGAHYTSERDIMKVIRSLFLDDLRAEFAEIAGRPSPRPSPPLVGEGGRRPGEGSSPATGMRRKRLENFQTKLRSLKFLDPACGCGNFLVLGYRELRKLELEAIAELHGTEQQALNVRDLCKVDVDQFYGLEYSEWPVRIAEVAMWLIDHQLNAQAAELFGQRFERLPLRASPHIVQANALRTDWNTVLPREQCSYVLGNPPFVGKQFQTAEQKQDMDYVCGKVKGAGVLDYVTGWYFKAAEYIHGTRIAVGFVSTNSISQGEQVGILWGELFQRWQLKINFAHRTFAWASEARGMAHVHVVIIGFSGFAAARKRIYEYNEDASEPTAMVAANISPYLVDASDIVVKSRSEPICRVPQMDFGSMPNDGGFLLFTKSGKEQFLKEEPEAADFFRRFVGAEEFLNGVERWCLWLDGVPPGIFRKLRRVMDCVEAVRIHRRRSTREATRKLENAAAYFGEIRQPKTRYVLVPGVSSERRAYIPIGFLPPDIISSNLVNVIPNATMWHFGVLSSAMHMAWVRTVAGRLKSDFRYSTKIVYNNFPWPDAVADKHREAVESAANTILKLRVELGDGRVGFLPSGAKNRNVTLASLYGAGSMPRELIKAHTELDRAVERCYRADKFTSDRERVEFLFRLYEQLTAPLLPATPAARGRRQSTAAATPRPRRGRTPGLPAQPS